MLQKLAAEFPEPSSLSLTLTWENDVSSAGVSTTEQGAEVFLNSASASVASLGGVADLLCRIFADEVVCVRAMEKGALVYCGLAPASDPSGGFNALDKHGGGRNMPDIDDVLIETWSSGLEEA